MGFIEIATKSGCMYTKWGPCFCSEKENKQGHYCISCENAEKIENSGKDWDEEYKKAEEKGFCD